MRQIIGLSIGILIFFTSDLLAHGGEQQHQEEPSKKTRNPQEDVSPTAQIPRSLKDAWEIISLSLKKIEIADQLGSSIAKSYAYRDDIKASSRYIQEHHGLKDEKSAKRLVSDLDQLIAQLGSILTRSDTGYMKLDMPEFQKLRGLVEQVKVQLPESIKN